MYTLIINQTFDKLISLFVCRIVQQVAKCRDFKSHSTVFMDVPNSFIKVPSKQIPCECRISYRIVEYCMENLRLFGLVVTLLLLKCFFFMWNFTDVYLYIFKALLHLNLMYVYFQK